MSAGAIENAYLALLGQIVLIASAVSFGVPYFLFTPSSPKLTPNHSTEFFLAFALGACIMMITNIIIGWAALRTAITKPECYTDQMFMVDLVIVIVLFAMNNVIMFAFGDTISLQNTATIKNTLGKGVPIQTIALMAFALYGLKAVFLLLCKLWNHEYYIKADVPQTTVYERALWVIIMIDFMTSICALIYRNHPRVQVALFGTYLFTWIYINGHWLKNFRMTKPLTKLIIVRG